MGFGIIRIGFKNRRQEDLSFIIFFGANISAIKGDHWPHCGRGVIVGFLENLNTFIVFFLACQGRT